MITWIFSFLWFVCRVLLGFFPQFKLNAVALGMRLWSKCVKFCSEQGWVLATFLSEKKVWNLLFGFNSPIMSSFILCQVLHQATVMMIFRVIRILLNHPESHL